MTNRRKQRRRLGYESRVVLLATAASLPWIVSFIVVLAFDESDGPSRWGLVTLLALTSFVLLAALRHNLAYPLRTLSNLISSIREEDYSFRARIASEDDALGEVMTEVNELTEMLRSRRLSTLESSALLRTVIAEIDSAIFAFDHETKLRLVNKAGERMMSRPVEILIGLTAKELGLTDLIDGEEAETIQHNFPGVSGRFDVRRSEFREEGRPHRLLVVTDLSRALREEERQAWKRLLRVLGHELNNSLAPIKSIAGSMETLIERDPLPDDFRDDLRSGLTVIRSRSEALVRFMEAYSSLARLPQPKLTGVDVGGLVRRVAALEHRVDVSVEDGPELVVQADPDQLEQLLINLVKNAVDAASENHGAVELSWAKSSKTVELIVRDEGPGLSGSTNLFVPFFTTKPGGSGIGLVLSRQIAEAHGGTLTLQDREDRSGCEAKLSLPM